MVGGSNPSAPTMLYFVYILQSLKDKKYYIGFSSNLQERLSRHNLGLSKSTKGRRPLKLVYYEKFNSKKEAINREKYFKTYKGWKERQNLIKNLGA